MVNTQLSVTIVAMTTDINSTACNITVEEINVNVVLPKNVVNDNQFTNSNFTNKSKGIYRTYEWSKFEQDLVLLSYFIGTIIFVFPTSILVQRYGGKIVLQCSYLVTGFTSLPIPWIVLCGGWQAICICRIVQGMALVSLYPSSHTLLGVWIPVSERGRFNSFVFTGSTVGIVLGYQVSGLLAGGAAGWPTTFWVTGALCLMTFLFVTLFTINSPLKSHRINKEEIKFIMGEPTDTSQKRKIPWKCIAASTHVWAAAISQAGTGMAYLFCLVQVPTYLNKVLRINIKNSGVLSSLPYIAKFFIGIGFAYLSDFCINKKYLSLKNTRRTSNSIGIAGLAVCLGFVTFTDDTTITTALFIISLGSCAVTYSGWLVNYIDLSPNFSGALIAGGNLLADIVVLTLPSKVHHIITDTSNRYQWRVLFLIVSTVAIVSNLVFLVFMSAEVQPWNDERDKRTDREVNFKIEHFEELNVPLKDTKKSLL